MAQLTASWADDFREWIIKEKFNGDVVEADKKKRQFVDQKQKQQLRERALQGLLIFR